MKLLDTTHVVSGWCPVDVNGGTTTSDVVNMKLWNRATVLLFFGDTTLGSDSDIAVYAADDNVPTHSAALATLNYRKSSGATTASGDVFAAEAQVVDSKLDLIAGGEIVPNSDDGCIVAIDVPASMIHEASDDYDMTHLYVAMSDPGQVCVVGCLIVLTEPRYSAVATPTAID